GRLQRVRRRAAHAARVGRRARRRGGRAAPEAPAALDDVARRKNHGAALAIAAHDECQAQRREQVVAALAQRARRSPGGRAHVARCGARGGSIDRRPFERTGHLSANGAVLVTGASSGIWRRTADGSHLDRATTPPARSPHPEEGSARSRRLVVPETGYREARSAILKRSAASCTFNSFGDLLVRRGGIELPTRGFTVRASRLQRPRFDVVFPRTVANE